MTATMQAVLLGEPGGPLTLGELPVPEPRAGQVLIRMAAAPINPSDLAFLQGSYGFRKPFPVVPGLEGSGTVVAAGRGLLPRYYMGKRVATAQGTGGTWAEYLVAPATSCVPLARRLSFDQGATLFVNPMTALAFLEMAKRGKHRAIVSVAAAGALGHMILRLGLRERIPVIHVVRRPEQVELLKSAGAEHVVNSGDPHFLERMARLAAELRATLVLDPLAGRHTRDLLDASPPGSTIVVYGRLSGENPEFSLEGFHPGERRVARFFLPDWLARKNTFEKLRLAARVQRLAPDELRTTIAQRFPLWAVRQALATSAANHTAGKILLVANGKDRLRGNGAAARFHAWSARR